MPGSVQNRLPQVFSYFDCTDYFEETDISGRPKGLLTCALNKKKLGAQRRMSAWDHVTLLWSYVFRQNPNVHGGYFEGYLCRQIIYRLACLGFDATVAAYGQISQGPKVFIRSKATCAAPLREVLSPCRGLRPHHVQRDRIGSWEVSRPAVRVV